MVGVAMDERTQTGAPEATPGQFGPPWLTVETGLYILLLLLGALLRFYALGRQPLQEAEAGLALDAWRFYSGGAASIRGHSPLLFHGNVLFYFLFQASDYASRIVPALAGTAIIALPYLLRSRLGRHGALVASAFLTISPSFLFFSRQLNGDIVAAAASLALVAGIFGYAAQRRPWQLYTVAAALAVALLSSGATYVVLLALTGFFGAAVVRSHLRSKPESSLVNTVFGEKTRPDNLVPALGLFGALLVLLPTGLLVNLHGMQATLDLLSLWLAQFQPVAGAQPWHYYLSLLVAYELPVVVFGLAGACYLSRRDPFFAFLLCWFGVGLASYTLMGTKPPAGILQILLPVTLLAARSAGDLLSQLSSGEQWLWGKLTLVVSLPVVFHLLMQAAAFGNPNDLGDPRHLALMLLSVFFFLCVASIVGVLSLDWRTSLHSAGLVVLAVLSSLTLHATWRLNYHQPGNPQEILVERPTSADVRNLEKAVEDLSNQREHQSQTVRITVASEEDPLLAWYLRSFRNLQFVPGAISSPTSVVITPLVEAQSLPEYRGARFRLQSSWQPASLSGHDLVNWFLFRESLQSPVHRDVMMWIAPENGE